MIGHYLLTLTPEQESRVLTEKLAQAGEFVRKDGCRCLIGVTRDYGRVTRLDSLRRIIANYARPATAEQCTDSENDVGIQFDDLCARFGGERINAAIRNRILANQARRALTHATELVG